VSAYALKKIIVLNGGKIRCVNRVKEGKKRREEKRREEKREEEEAEEEEPVEDNNFCNSRVFSKKKTTHMICTILSASKTENFMNRHKPSNIIHFVHPNWYSHFLFFLQIAPPPPPLFFFLFVTNNNRVLQSCKAGQLLPEESFSILKKVSKDVYFY
jgi:hypothetical protein